MDTPQEETPQEPIKRLCSEIQLFDLCDLDACSHKDGRFCTEGQVLQRFEAIKEEDEQYLAEELDEDADEDEDALEDDDAFGGDDEYEDDEF